MSHPENFEPGQWVAIVRSHPDEESPDPLRPARPKYTITGEPLQIVEISTPFFLMTDLLQRQRVLDIRYCELTRCSQDYVESFRPAQRVAELPQWQVPWNAAPEVYIFTDSIKEAKEKQVLVAQEEKQDLARRCPNCGDKLVETKQLKGPWLLRCRQCGFTGGLPSS